MKRQSTVFGNVNTAADDTCLIAFTSGTTGIPKATMHFHRDVMAICVCWPGYVLKPNPDDVFIGSPPFAFTFGLGGLLLFPMAVGASTVLLDKAGPTQLLDGIKEFGAMVKALQDFVISVAAPYKYPRAIEFTGKLQRFKLRQQ
jgi:2-aminobenzoate-CoA ligase